MLDQAQGLRNLVNGKDSSSYKPRIITVTSGKGGVGKSNIVVNLSITLQKMGKRVLIFDADIGMGNDDVLMGFLPKFNIFDIIASDKKIEDVMVTGPYGVKLLPGGTGFNKYEELTEEERDKFINQLTKIEDMDFIIMDTGAGINRTVLSFSACCDELIILTTPEPTSLTDAYSLLKAINHFKLKLNAKVIINKVLDEKDGLMTFNKFNNVVTTFLKMDLEYLGKVNEDKKLMQAVRLQQPLVTLFPDCEASQDIKNIALKLIGTNSGINGLGAKGLFKKLFSIFS